MTRTGVHIYTASRDYGSNDIIRTVDDALGRVYLKYLKRAIACNLTFKTEVKLRRQSATQSVLHFFAANISHTLQPTRPKLILRDIQKPNRPLTEGAYQRSRR